MREQLQAENVGETRSEKRDSVPEVDKQHESEPPPLGPKGSQAIGAFSEVLDGQGPGVRVLRL